jgi:hypothetical protein
MEESRTADQMKQVVKIRNSLSPEQRKEMAEKLNSLIRKYETLSSRSTMTGKQDAHSYFEGVADGLNHAYKLMLQINDDYNNADYRDVK